MAVIAAPPPAVDPPASSRPLPRPVPAALVLAALGVVFGDIGTSPLYALKTAFTAGGGIALERASILGVLSMVVWTITLVVSVKYVTFVMRASNRGEGGVIALLALVQRLQRDAGRRPSRALLLVGVAGAALFVGDAVITPAISVLSAVEGLEVVDPALGSAVLPLALAVLIALFAVQRFGTHAVGRFFGPVCAVWFAALAAAGLAQVIHHPGVLAALSPTFGASFALDHPGLAMLALTGVVLTITGVEALYADMGHFGRPAIARGWFWIVFPALTLNYLGQGALLLHQDGALENPFFLLYPEWAQLPMVLLATAATVIASQAVVSGAYSLARQAMQLGLLPRLTVRHTSDDAAGQIELPAVTRGLFLAVVGVVLAFGSSAALAAAYGLAVTGTLITTTVLFVVVLRTGRRRRRLRVAVVGGGFLLVDGLLLAATAGKLDEGGWFPLLLGATVAAVLLTWDRGRALVTARRAEQEGPLRELLEDLRAAEPGLVRVPGTAVFLTPDLGSAPLALRAEIEHAHVLHRQVLLVAVDVTDEPHVPDAPRIGVDELGAADDGVTGVVLHYGFRDRLDVPAGLERLAAEQPHRGLDLPSASWFVSRAALRPAPKSTLPRWQRALFLTVARHAASPIEHFALPYERTVVVGGHIAV